jgi:hypothetical protein
MMNAELSQWFILLSISNSGLTGSKNGCGIE